VQKGPVLVLGQQAQKKKTGANKEWENTRGENG